MAGDFWEQAVETYLTLDRGVFLNPQYLIGTPGEWEANPDFLALCFPDREVWMVEVTKSPSGGLRNKIAAFEIDYAPKLRDQIQLHRVVPDTAMGEWTIGLWIFAPATAKANLTEQARKAGVVAFRFTPLEETTVPNWQERFR